MTTTLKLIAASACPPNAPHLHVLQLPNDADPLAAVLTGVDCVELHFPKFTDGRAFSQAFLLRHRLGFTGTIRATGDVLIDQLLQMQRTGFSEAVLRADQDLAHGQKLLSLFPGFYQADAQHARPHFARESNYAGPSQAAKARSAGSTARQAANLEASS